MKEIKTILFRAWLQLCTFILIASMFTDIEDIEKILFWISITVICLAINFYIYCKTKEREHG